MSEGLFTHTVQVTVFMSGTFDLFDIMCKQHHRTALNPFLNGTKNGDVDGTCKRSLRLIRGMLIFLLLHNGGRM